MPRKTKQRETWANDIAACNRIKRAVIADESGTIDNDTKVRIASCLTQVVSDLTNVDMASLLNGDAQDVG